MLGLKKRSKVFATTWLPRLEIEHLGSLPVLEAQPSYLRRALWVWSGFWPDPSEKRLVRVRVWVGKAGTAVATPRFGLRNGQGHKCQALDIKETLM